MKIKPLNYFRCLVICLVSLLLCACQAGAAVPNEETQTPPESGSGASYQSAFTSTDGSVSFVMDIDQAVDLPAGPVVQVQPHFLTGEDAKRVAQALFPDAAFFEAEPEQAENLSKGEIQAKLDRWSQYADMDALTGLCGDAATADYAERIAAFLADYQRLYDQAPAENSHTPCQWEMRNEAVYSLTAQELAEASTADFNDEVSAQFTANGIPYRFTASTRNKSDYQVNIISCYIYDGICPRNLDDEIFTARLCRTGEPSQAQLELIKSQAQPLLSAFALGQWQVDECDVKREAGGSEAEYLVYVNAVPVLSGVAALRQPQIGALRSPDGKSDYYLTDANFVFSANGDLISFSLFSPLDIQETVSEDVQPLGIEGLLAQAQQHLTQTCAYGYGNGFGSLLQGLQTEVQCTVTVSEIEYGLARTGGEGSFRYVPALALKGTSEYIGKADGKTYYTSEAPELLLVMNAADGTIIRAANG